MIRINLLGSEAQEQARDSWFRMPDMGVNANQVGIGALLVGVLLLISGAWWYQTGRLQVVRAELAAIEAERTQLEQVAEQVETLQERTDVLREKLGVIVELKASQTGPVMLLDEISRRLADGLWMTRLDLDGNDVEIRGSALSEVSVADFTSSLERSDYFSNVRLRTLGDSGEELNFQITLIFDPTPGQMDLGAGATGVSEEAS